MEEISEYVKEITSGVKLIPQILVAYDIGLKIEIDDWNSDSIKSFLKLFLSLQAEHKDSFGIKLLLKEEQYNRDIQMKYWCIMLTSFFIIEQKNKKEILTVSLIKYLSNIIKELYAKQLLYLDNILLLLKFITALGMISFKSPIKKENSLSSVKSVQFSIIIIYLVFNPKLSAQEWSIVSSFLHYFIEYVLSYEYNATLIYHLDEMMLILDMISNQGPVTPSNKNIVDALTHLLSKVFEKKFNQKIFNHLIEYMKKILVNFHKKFLPDLLKDINKANSIIELIKKMNSNDLKIGKVIQSGFFLTDSIKSGMNLPVQENPNSFSLLFSFSTNHPNLDTSTQTLISFLTKKKQNNNSLIFSIIIKNGGLSIITNKETRPFAIEIKKNETYCMLITYSKKFTIHCNEITSQIALDLNWKEESKCCIGYNEMNNETINHFVGKIGSIIFFEGTFKKGNIKIVRSFETEYHKILLSRYDQSTIERYNYFNPRFLNLSESNQQTAYFLSQVKWSITPEMFSLYKMENKISFKHKIHNHDNEKINKEFSKVHLLFPFSSQFHIFNNKITIVEFMKLNGIQFICLQLEYYNQLLNLLSKFTEEEQQTIIGVIYTNLENIFYLINIVYNNHIHLFEEEFNEFFYHYLNIITSISNKAKLTQGILLEFFTFLSCIKTIQQEILQDNLGIVFYSKLRNKCLLFLMNSELYDFGKENSILTDLFDIIKKILENDKENNEILTISMLNNLLLFIDLLSDKPIQIKTNNATEYKSLLLLFLLKAHSLNNKEIISSIINFVKIKASETHICFNLIEMFYYSGKVLSEFSSFTQILYELLKLPSEETIEKTYAMINDDITKEKLLALVTLCLFNYSNLGDLDNRSSISTIFPETGLYMLKAIITSLIPFNSMNSKEKLEYTLNRDCNLPKEMNWQNNHDKTIFLLNICAIIITSKGFNHNDLKEGYMFIMNCLSSLLNLLQIKNGFEPIRDLFGTQYKICFTLFKHALKLNFLLDQSTLIICILESHEKCFLFKFILLESQSKNPSPMLIDLIELIGRQIICGSQLRLSSLTYGNFINYLILLYNLIKSQAIPFEKKYNLIGKLFESLKKNGILYYKIEVIIDKEKNVKKLILEMLFEMLMELQKLIQTDSESKEYSKLFDYFYVRTKENKNLTLPCYSDLYKYQSQEHEEIELIISQNNKVNSNINCTMLFLLKSFVYKFYYFKEVSSDSYFKAKFDQFILILMADVTSSYKNTKKHFSKDNKCVNKMYSYLKSLIESSNKLEMIETEFIQFLKNNDSDDLKILMYYEKTNIIQLPEMIITNKFATTKNNLPQQIGNLERLSNPPQPENYRNKNNTNTDSFENKGYVLNPHKYFLLTVFGKSFHDIFFYNEEFVNMQKVYVNMFDVNQETKKMNFPSKVRNFTNRLYPPLFLKQDYNFFNNEFFHITHQYYEPLLEPNNIKTIVFKKRKRKFMNLSSNYQCELISIENACFGDILIYKECIIFNSGNEKFDPRNNPTKLWNYLFSSMKTDIVYNHNKQLFFFYSEISEIFIRRFLLMNQAIEIYLKNGKSYFFNLFKSSFLNEFISLIKSHQPNFSIIDYSTKEASLLVNDKIKKWSRDDLTTFDLLLFLNKYGTRTFRDVNQYPILPWLLYTYDDLSKVKKLIYRNLKYPISIQSNEKVKEIQMKYQESSESSKFGSHFGCHYSTAPFVYYYLMRLTPFTQSMIKLQNKELEASNRMFISFDDTLKILSKTDDNRELIPQFFIMIEMFLNLNCINLKKRKKKDSILTQVDDLEINSNDKCPLNVFVDFIYRHQRLLNSKEIKENLYKWVNYIFGVNQLEKKEGCCNIFPKYTYAQKYDLESKYENLKQKYTKNDMKILQSMKDKIQMVINFGQTPPQLLKETMNKFQLIVGKTDEYEGIGSKINLRKKKNMLGKDVVYFIFDNRKEKLLLLKKHTIEIFDCQTMNKKRTVKIKPYASLLKFKINSLPRITPYKPHYTMITLRYFSVFVIGRHLDQTFKLFNENNNELNEVLCETFVSAIAKINEEHFFTGLLNGKLIEWELEDKLKCIQRRYILAHDSPIHAIYINEFHNIIITSSEDSAIFIRKIYDFELLSVIHVDQGSIGVDIKMSTLNFIYILYYKSEKQTFILKGYTLNGLNFASSQEDCYSNFEITQTGNIIVGYHNSSKVTVLYLSTLESLKTISLSSSNEIITWFNSDMLKDVIYFIRKNGEFVEYLLN